MIDIWNDILQIYSEYIGTGIMMALFFASLFYLWVGEKEIQRKLVFLYFTICILVLFFSPWFAWLIYENLDSEIYYRILWLMPVTIVIAYAGGRVVLQLKGYRRFVAMAGACIILAVSGDYVYDNIYYSKAENAYHVPDTVIEICDEIMVEGREVKAVFPLTMLQYVRQYTPYVCMPYGREMIVERWKIYNEMYEVYEANVPIAQTLAETARRYGCHYIIIDEKREMDGVLTDYEFELKKVIDGYEIYVDLNAELDV